MRNFFSGIPLIYDFWKEFDYVELMDSMRQKDESDFFHFLNRIRIALPKKEDIELLQSLCIKIKNIEEKVKEAVLFFKKLLSENKSVLALFSKNEHVNEFNQRMSDLTNIQVYEINAEDTEIGVVKRLRVVKETKKIKKASETAGLEECLKIGLNSRVMLRRNIDLSKGLCNGKLGYVKKVNFGMNNRVESLQIIFDNQEHETTIERIEANYQLQKNIYVKRRQFPICLAWGITIHKCQGLSLDGVLVDLGESIFESGMAYVALSRA